MKERLKLIRKQLGITQAQMSEELNFTKAYIGMVECGSKPLSDRTIRDICRRYNVSEAWLRTGDGEPFAPQSRADHIRAFVESALEDEPDSIRQRWLYVFSNLSLDDWEVLDRMAQAYVEGKEKDEG